ncbi:PPE domain-containing protein [Nocardia otitidiscaviarum]|uniref:PPE domain-containing protein n=1 Tax=Nocardia otitidiscaviarum TaxID=1823 RepID=A0A516NUA4_9NOCA|nr:PPE domain-containing protein [Nocardia otitidiscaviarum]MCP9621880.1 PPE family protein [Nocardia otitidiscaviarum]QDP82497.1 PPE domain-containing protein [Nocardia otitidiscaviarum]
MTLGITGVFWLPRMAEVNSVTLNAGAHAIPIAAASTSWSAITAAWVDATTTVARVMAEIGVGLQGINGLNVLGRLGGFTVWAEQQGVMAATLAAKTAANATAYTVASIAMPSLPEIAAVEAARIAAHSTGGALNGSAQAAEAAKLALDIRAALVMETYEAATTAIVTTPGEFLMPPPIAMGAGSADPAAAAQSFGDSGNPVQTALAAAAALANNPGVMSAVSQAAQFAGSVATTGVSTAGNVAGTAMSAVGTALQSGNGVSSMPVTAGGGAAAAVGIGGMAAATHAVSFGGGGGTVSIGNGAGSLRVPEGWGASGGFGAGAPTAAAPGGETAAARAEAAAPVRSNTAGSPLLGGQARDDEEQAREGSGYGRSADHFADGRVIAPAVIGATPEPAE